MTIEQAIFELGYAKDFQTSTRVEAINIAINALEQVSKTSYISIDDVMSVFDDFMSGNVSENDSFLFYNMLKDKVDSDV